MQVVGPDIFQDKMFSKWSAGPGHGNVAQRGKKPIRSLHSSASLAAQISSRLSMFG
jgi:hypothetical protein